MMIRESDREPRLSQIDSAVDEMTASIVEGLVRGLEQSVLFKRVADVLEALQVRIASLEQGMSQSALRNRIEKLEGELLALKAEGKDKEKESVEPPPPPRPSLAPLAPPANMPQSPTMSSVPFGLSAEPVKRTTMRRPRARTQVRPTVVYRTDPRAAVTARPSVGTAPAEPAADSTICSEPDCDRVVRCRGLCSLHYQRVRYKERKIEHKQANDGPLPPPPPPKRRPSSSIKKKEGGTRGIFALLYEEKGRRTLAGLINQMKFDRTDLVERLNRQFVGLPGIPLNEEDTLRAIHYHKLGDALRAREGEIICRHLSKQLGSLAKTAQKMKMDQDQLMARVEELDLQEEVARVRNEFRERILEHTPFSDRLDLALTREKYLKDLGIEDEVDKSLRDEIDKQLSALTNTSTADQAEEAIREALALDAQRTRRMVRRYDLDKRLQAFSGFGEPEASDTEDTAARGSDAETSNGEVNNASVANADGET